ncbi:MAG TPA: MFS transporter [Desulfomonilia bacterium]|nr:MFS transporter [Desulfomonilia bacterium]
MRTTLRALRSRNYRLFFTGQGISLMGTWMQQTAMSWLVYRLTGSALILGIIGFSTQIPMLFFSPIAGVYADRMDRYRLIIATQFCAMLQAFALAFLTLSGMIHVWHLFILSALLGVINAFDMPIRQSFVVEMIENRADLGNAIALNSFLFNGARLVGPSVAGVLIGMTSEGTCFLINGFSFLAVLVALLSMSIKRRDMSRAKDSIMNELKGGLTYVRGFMPIRYILINLALMSFMGMPYAVLMPVFAKDILKGGPETLGFLMASTGFGAIVGALFLASRKSVLGLERLIVFSSLLFGSGIVLFALSESVLLSAALLTVTGFGMMVQMVGSNTIVQTILDEEMRGRVMSFFAVSFAGTMPFGSLYAGAVASSIGAPMTLVISGFICIAASLAFYRRLPAIRDIIHPIYRKMGIIPDRQP